MISPLSKKQNLDLADQLDRLAQQVVLGQLIASASMVSMLRGAAVALRVGAGLATPGFLGVPSPIIESDPNVDL